MNTPKTLIIIGRSGSGKGTQVELLKDYLEKKHSASVYHFESGALFRKLIQSEGYTSDRIRMNMDAGKLVPDIITDWLLMDGLVQNLNDDDQVVIFDGYPRTLDQIETINTALKYYGRSSAIVLHIDVSEEEVRKRMASRGRSDDANMKALESRIQYYNDNIIPAIEALRNHSDYKVIDINGEGDVDAIHEIIRKELGLTQ